MDKLAIAIHQTAHNFKSRDPQIPDGPQGLAKLVGMREGTFYNQVNPNNEGHAPNIYTVEAMLLHTKDTQILDVLEAQCGRVAYKLPDMSKVGDTALLEDFAKFVKEFGDVGNRLTEALRDGDMTEAEVTDIEKEFSDVVAAGAAMIARLRNIQK